MSDTETDDEDYKEQLRVAKKEAKKKADAEAKAKKEEMQLAYFHAQQAKMQQKSSNMEGVRQKK